MLPPIIFSAIIYWHAGLHDDPINFLIFGIVVTMVNVVSSTLCLAVGALVRSLSLANLIAGLCLLYSLLLCGYASEGCATMGVVVVCCVLCVLLLRSGGWVMEACQSDCDS